MDKINVKTIKNLTLIVLILTLNPQFSHQNIIQATCVYSINNEGIYTCTINNAILTNPTDELEIIGNHLAGYTDDHVHSVTHFTSTIRYFNGEVLRKFQNLKDLHLFNLGLFEISATAFAVCPNLEDLTIGYHSQFSSLPSEMVKNCQNLKNIGIVYNILTEVPADLFGSTSNLEQFNVAGNKLTSLPENLLQNMHNLRYFAINSNLFTELNPNLLKNAPNLEEVYAADNKFVDQQAVTNALNGFTNLTILALRDNIFTNFDFKFFEQFQKLRGLTIGSSNGPQLTDISWHSLPSSLIEIIIDGIGEEIPENAFENLVNLLSLSLSGSGIENLQKDTFKPLTSLTMLYIEYTNIKVLHPELFTNLINLRNINLSNNKIEELPVGVFAPLVNLGIGNDYQGVRMNSNNIKRLNSNAFGQHPYMRYINFYQNKINEIERGLFSKFHSSMTTANFLANVCIDRSFTYATNLDQHENLLWCFNNWAGITTTTTTTSTQPSITTTPGGCGGVFRKFEVFLMIFIGFVKFLVDFVRL